MTAPVRSTCPYCGVGCGVLARARVDGGFDIEGDPVHPANRGALCSKGSTLAQTLGQDTRLLQPEIDGHTVEWNAALEHVARRFSDIIAQHGPDSVAFYVSGQLLTEDYYVANKLMKGYIGSANIDTNSRLCMSSAVAAHKRAFGEDLVPVCYEDLDLADLLVLVGSNTAWCHPVLYQRMLKAREARPSMKIVVIDPRRTATAELADLHLPLRPGTDVWLFNGLLAWLSRHGHTDARFVDAHTSGLPRALLVADNTAGDIESVARRCGVEPEALLNFYQLFAAHERVISAFSQGVKQSSSGTDKANAIINCHLLTGRIGRPGMGPFSITGQPNAMGGREVGGMANMLAAHMDIENTAQRELVQRFWDSPTIAARQGLKAVDMFEAIHDGRIRAVWIMATNPVVSLPNADRARAALRRCELVVVSDCVRDTDTNRLAHVLLPAAGWGEKDGTVTNSDRHISRQRAFLPLSGAARPDWWIISQVAQRMGFAGFDYKNAAQIFTEHARLSGEGNDGRRMFDIAPLGALTSDDYDALTPLQWPVRASLHGTPRLFGDGRFMHGDGRARFIATTPRAPAKPRDEEFPLVLNTGRIRDQWHTMTRTALAPTLNGHLAEPYVDLHPQDALALGLRPQTLVRVATRWGRMVGRLRTSGEMRRGEAFVPIHWNDVQASDARVGALVNPVVDPVSGEPEFKHTPARVEPFFVAWYGFAVTRRQMDLRETSWWSRAADAGSVRYELAGRRVPASWSARARMLLGVPDDADWLEYEDPHAGLFRGAWLVEGRIEACLCIAPHPELPSRSWLASLFGKTALADIDRASLLAGRPLDPAADTGEVICACFGVGRNTLVKAILGGCGDTRQLGEKLRAGTNCGSCVPELRRLIEATQAQ